MYELIITEKPAASKKIAEALADGKPIQEGKSGVWYYKVTHGDKDIIVACAVGHLFGLAEKKKKGMQFPVFDIEWTDISKVNKGAAFTKKYAAMLKKLSKDASSFTVACDFDVEGEVIGWNVIRFICKQKDASRMKFSTLTKPDLVKAYENKMPSLEWGQAKAGETRHMMDWMYGINTSRALTSAIKKAGRFKILSAGRVQGPTLKIIVDKEKQILSFKPTPYWQIELKGKVNKTDIEAWHLEDKFWKKEKADSVIKNTKDEKTGKIKKIDKRQFKQASPNPFDLTTLQTESYRNFGISPKETLSIAQSLYLSGLISYPRTSSQQLPENIGYEKILKALSKKYKLASSLLKKKDLTPNDGKKTDPAHPAIYPTGSFADLDGREQKVYDLIVKRFLATFADSAVRETVKIEINLSDELFIAKGTRTIEKGWHEFYAPYVKLEEQEMPKVAEDDSVDVKKIILHKEQTKPPKRYTPASIIKEMDRLSLGTKATRSETIDKLYKRDYIQGKQLEATQLGIKTIETLAKYSPKIIDVALTRHFEVEMEDIREGKKKEEDVLDEAKEIITKILSDFKKKEKEIGEALLDSHIKSEDKLNTVGKCPNCDGILMIKRGKFGRFISCTNYEKCETTFNLPNTGFVKVSDKVCEHCNHPIITMTRRGKRPQEVCINKECPAKHVEVEEGKKCSKCKEGEMILRKSVYGSFLGCSRFPKCRNTEKLDNSK